MSRNNWLLILLLVCIVRVSFGQALYTYELSIPFRDNQNRPIAFPSTGGLQSPNFHQTDINGDGRKDLIIFERWPKKIMVFINNGSTSGVQYQYEPELYNIFPSDIKDYIMFKDVNCDGIPDLIDRGFSGVRFTIGKRKSNGMWQADYSKAIFYYNPSQGTTSNNVYVNPNGDIPMIFDVDNDGDIDILAFDIIFPYLNYYKNVRVEQNLPCDSNKFEITSWCYGGLRAFNSDWGFNVLCKTGTITNKPHHGASMCLTDIDIDGDGDFDILSGFYDFPHMPLVVNSGNPSNPIFNSQDTFYNTQSGDIIEQLNMPIACKVDYNLDGKMDLIVAGNQGNGWDNHNYTLYKNNNSIGFSINTDNSSYLNDMTIDLGSDTHPALFDIDFDGDLDLFIASSMTKNKQETVKSRIAYFKNIGTVSVPSFQLITYDYLGLSTLNVYDMHPSFGDVDNDGDYDLLVGYESGLVVKKNNANTPMSTPDFSTPAQNFPALDSARATFSNRIFANLTPIFFDVDKDGHKDIVMGEKYGNLFLFLNAGIPNSMNYHCVSTIMGGVDVSGDNDPFFNWTTSYEGYSVPYIGTVDNTDSIYLLVGNMDGQIIRYTNVSDYNNLYPEVDTFLQNQQVGIHLAPVLGNLHASRNQSMVLGNNYGGIVMKVRNKDGYDAISHHQIQWPISIYPNPANHHLILDCPSWKEFHIQSVAIYDIMGRLILERFIDQSETEIVTTGWTDGMYLVVFSADNGDRQSYRIRKSDN